MNEKLIKINEILDNLCPVNEVGLQDRLVAVQARIKKIADEKRKARLQRAEQGDTTPVGVIGGVKRGAKAVGGATLGTAKAFVGSDKFGGSATELLLMSLGVPPVFADKIRDLVGKALDKIGDTGKMTPEQEKEYAEKEIDKIRQKDGDSFYVSYNITKKDRDTNLFYPPDTEVWGQPIKALSRADVENVFKKLMDKKIKDEPDLFNAKYEIKDVSDRQITLPSRTRYKIKVDYSVPKDPQPRTRTIYTIARSNQDVEDNFNAIWKMYIAKSGNPDSFFRSKVDNTEITEE